jgi:hypothetical protein
MNEKEQLKKLLKEFYDTYLLSDLFTKMNEDDKFEISKGHRTIKKALNK